MSLPSIESLVALYEKRPASAVGQAEFLLFQEYGLEPLIPLLIGTFPQVRSGYGRHSILFGLLRFSRQRQDVVDLAIGALRDRAYLVRTEACAALAYSLRCDAIQHLSSLQHHKDPKTRADAAAAVDAINHKNHHYYVDRAHTGSTFWEVTPHG